MQLNIVCNNVVTWGLLSTGISETWSVVPNADFETWTEIINSSSETWTEENAQGN